MRIAAQSIEFSRTTTTTTVISARGLLLSMESDSRGRDGHDCAVSALTGHVAECQEQAREPITHVIARRE
jgi:hypothetical protein